MTEREKSEFKAAITNLQRRVRALEDSQLRNWPRWTKEEIQRPTSSSE
jgi:hypothetical protein